MAEPERRSGDRRPFDRSEMDSRLLSELRVPSRVAGDACPTTVAVRKGPGYYFRVPSELTPD